MSQPQKTGKQYWRSLDDLAETPEFQRFVEHEFPGFAGHLSGSTSRRHFLKVMGASFALAGASSLTGCIRWPEENIVPFASRPEGFQPGIPAHYATQLEVGGIAHPLVASSYDGRPIKIEGNSQHPQNQKDGQTTKFGPANAWMQASVLELYDPDRSRELLKAGPKGQTSVEGGWSNAELQQLFTQIRQQGQGQKNIAVLAEASSSPSLAALKNLVGANRWFEYEAVSRDNEREGVVSATGSAQRVHASYDKAEVIVSLDADFLMNDPSALTNARAFADGRRGTNGKMNRLHMLEARFSVTGASADHRVPVAASHIPALVGRLAHELGKVGVSVSGIDAAPEFVTAGDNMGGTIAAGVVRMAQDLKVHAGRSIVVAGPDQPAPVHALTLAINVALGNVGKTVFLTQDPEPNRKLHGQAISELTAAMNQGSVDTLLILGGNPVYNAPADVGFEAALEKVPNSMHLSYHVDETSMACKWHLPRAHYLEAWSDGRAANGTYTLAQPLILPMTFDGHEAKNFIELLSLIFEAKPRTGYEIVRQTFDQNASGGDVAWEKALQGGFVAQTAWTPGRSAPSINTNWVPRLREQGTVGDLGNQVDVVFAQDYKLYDGRFANNGWLQELPDPMTKVTWDNAALMGPATAKKHGVKSTDMIRMTVAQKELEVAVYVLPGIANDTVVLPLGYGRLSQYGDEGAVFQRPAGFVSYNARNGDALKIATGTGFNAYAIRSQSAMWGAPARGTIAKGTGTYEIASTQDHHSIQVASGQEDSYPSEEMANRQYAILARGEFEDYKEDASGFVAAAMVRPDAEHGAHGGHDDGHGDGHGDDHAGDGEKVPHDKGHGHGDNESLWHEHEYTGYKWGMSIDLSTCTGCSACVTACQAENNIAVVGKEETARGREMHWIRVDRYFSGKDPHEVAEDPTEAAMNPELIEALHQPLTCQQCENAPCESVCPVAATVHSEEGLNDMVYNRCIGTRYCSNNCPYKVRRFNYFNNHKVPTEAEQMVYNPEVTVRNRGVMEKCTFCVQRIQATKITAKNEGRKVRDGEITPACAQTCPSEAIVFGDLNDPESKVAKAHHDARSYTLLKELNVKPRNRFQAKLLNPMGDES